MAIIADCSPSYVSQVLEEGREVSRFQAITSLNIPEIYSFIQWFSTYPSVTFVAAFDDVCHWLLGRYTLTIKDNPSKIELRGAFI